MLEQIIGLVVEVVCAVVCFLIGKYIIPRIKQSSAYSTLESLKTWIDTYVQGVEQTTTESGAGTIKLEVVIKLATEKANELGLNITQEDLRYLIEQCVKSMNDGEKTTLKVEQ